MKGLRFYWADDKGNLLSPFSTISEGKDSSIKPIIMHKDEQAEIPEASSTKGKYKVGVVSPDTGKLQINDAPVVGSSFVHTSDPKYSIYDWHEVLRNIKKYISEWDFDKLDELKQFLPAPMKHMFDIYGDEKAYKMLTGDFKQFFDKNHQSNAGDSKIALDEKASGSFMQDLPNYGYSGLTDSLMELPFMFLPEGNNYDYYDDYKISKYPNIQLWKVDVDDDSVVTAMDRAKNKATAFNDFANDLSATKMVPREQLDSQKIDKLFKLYNNLNNVDQNERENRLADEYNKLLKDDPTQISDALKKNIYMDLSNKHNKKRQNNILSGLTGGINKWR